MMVFAAIVKKAAAAAAVARVVLTSVLIAFAAANYKINKRGRK